jgi:hypothetical protein
MYTYDMQKSMCTCSLFSLISATPTENAFGGARALAFRHEWEEKSGMEDAES